MPDLTVTIGGRDYEVACQEGEERYLQFAAQLLDNEAKVLTDQIGRLPEPRMLLMSGLMLADKTSGYEEQLRHANARLDEMQREIERLRQEARPEPERIEVPVIPEEVIRNLSDLVEQAESLASGIEGRVASA